MNLGLDDDVKTENTSYIHYKEWTVKKSCFLQIIKISFKMSLSD